MKIDHLDAKILGYLVENSRVSFTEVAKKINVSPGTIHIRVKKLEDSGFIKSTSVNIDYEKAGYSFTSYVGIILNKTTKMKEVIDSLYKIPNITVANIVSGKFDIFCKIRSRSPKELKDVILQMDEVIGIMRTESIISLEESFNDRARLLNDVILKEAEATEDEIEI